MKVYSKNNKYPTPLPFKIILSDGSARTDPSTFTEEEIADAGYVEVPLKPHVNYPMYVDWIEGEWVVKTYDLEYQKTKKLEQLTNLMNAATDRPALDTGLGFSVDAGYTDLLSFEVGLELGITSVRSTDNVSHDVTIEQLQSIVNMIKQNGLQVLQLKWNLEDSIKSATTQEELDAVDLSILS